MKGKLISGIIAGMVPVIGLVLAGCDSGTGGGGGGGAENNGANNGGNNIDNTSKPSKPANVHVVSRLGNDVVIGWTMHYSVDYWEVVCEEKNDYAVNFPWKTAFRRTVNENEISVTLDTTYNQIRFTVYAYENGVESEGSSPLVLRAE
jgi:hypothetical protein